MGWRFAISTGELSLDGKIVATGYAGGGSGKNNPECCGAQMGTLGRGNFGPLPVGKYTIGPPYNDEHRGQYTMQLIPAAENQMHGRSGFLIHADSIREPGTASEGCIVPVSGVDGETGFAIRAMIAASPDRELEVEA